jgi:hypothetical protein
MPNCSLGLQGTHASKEDDDGILLVLASSTDHQGPSWSWSQTTMAPLIPNLEQETKAQIWRAFARPWKPKYKGHGVLFTLQHRKRGLWSLWFCGRRTTSPSGSQGAIWSRHCPASIGVLSLSSHWRHKFPWLGLRERDRMSGCSGIVQLDIVLV